MSTNRTSDATFIREVSIRYRGARLGATDRIGHPRDAVRLAQKIVKDDAREHFFALYVDSRHHLIAYSTVSIGTANQSLVHPREVFQPAVLAGAVAVLILHNHPSGNSAPSREDHDVTRRLAKAGEILGIRILDHLVWTREGDYYSFAESSPDALAPGRVDDARVHPGDTPRVGDSEHRCVGSQRCQICGADINGVVLYQGPSLIDGEPIIAILTGLRAGSGNRKTGAMLQTWILCRDVSPVRAWQDGGDYSVCGSCPHRHRSQGGMGTCYVNKGQAPLSIWRAYHRGRYPRIESELTMTELCAGRDLRIGSYGDPGAVPAWIWRALSARARSRTGYTHRWRRVDLSDLCMASVDSASEAQEAQLRGYRTFRVTELAEGRMRGEAL
ncbi:MAG: RadC family protein [Myxococcota bacterium]